MARNNALNIQSEVAGDFASSSHSFPHNVLNLLNAQSSMPRDPPPFIDTNALQHCSRQLIFENAVHQMLNMQRSPSTTIFDSPTSPPLDHEHCFVDALVDLSYLPEENEMGMNENLFSTFLRPVVVDNGGTEQPSSFDSRESIHGDSSGNGSQSSVATPLLEMGFSMRHVRKAIDATSMYSKVLTTLFFIINAV